MCFKTALLAYKVPIYTSKVKLYIVTRLCGFKQLFPLKTEHFP